MFTAIVPAYMRDYLLVSAFIRFYPPVVSAFWTNIKQILFERKSSFVSFSILFPILFCLSHQFLFLSLQIQSFFNHWWLRWYTLKHTIWSFHFVANQLVFFYSCELICFSAVVVVVFIILRYRFHLTHYFYCLLG